MLLFAQPLLLLLAAPVVLLGLFALYRGRQKRLVPSTLLWRTVLAQHSAATRARRIDPAWLLLTLATLAAVLALAGPRWTHRPAPAAPALTHLAFRSLPGQPTGDLFVQSSAPVPLRLVAGSSSLDMPGDELAGGLTRRLSLTTPLTLTLSTPAGGRASFTLTPPAHPAFRLTTLGPVPPALVRLFRMQSVPDAPADAPLVALIAGNRPAPADAVLIVRTPGAAATLQAIPDARQRPTLAAAGDPLLASVDLSAVRASALTPLTLDATWRPIAAIANQPWLAARTPASGPIDIALASPLVPSATNWPLDPSFVIFFANALHAAGLSADPMVCWTVTSTTPPAPAPGQPRDLTSAALVLALLTAAAGAALVTRRTA